MMMGELFIMGDSVYTDGNSDAILLEIHDGGDFLGKWISASGSGVFPSGIVVVVFVLLVFDSGFIQPLFIILPCLQFAFVEHAFDGTFEFGAIVGIAVPFNDDLVFSGCEEFIQSVAPVQECYQNNSIRQHSQHYQSCNYCLHEVGVYN